MTIRTIDLAALTPAQGLYLQAGPGASTGWSVAGLGDFNRDGNDDLLIGAPREVTIAGNKFESGLAYVLFGSRLGFGSTVAGRQTVDLTALERQDGLLILGASNILTGYGVAGAGDVDGDGDGDLLVALIGLDPNDGTKLDAAGVLGIYGTDKADDAGFGTAFGNGQIFSLTSLINAPEKGFLVVDNDVDEIPGFGVSGLGDINNDGYDDFVFNLEKTSGVAGNAYVVFGSKSGIGTPSPTVSTIDAPQLSSQQGFIIKGTSDAIFGNRDGFAITGAGDINGDGFDDIVIGVDGDDVADSKAYVIFGNKGPFGTQAGAQRVIDLANLSANQGFSIGLGDVKDGVSVAGPGDINGDGIDDLLIGAQADGSTPGTIYAILGSKNGFPIASPANPTIDATRLSANAGFLVQGDARLGLGYNVGAIGDINGDGLGDFGFNVDTFDTNGQFTGPGTQIVFGSKNGFGTTVVSKTDGTRQILDIGTIDAGQGLFLSGSGGIEAIGAAGDINGDGIDDLIIGAPDGLSVTVEGDDVAVVLFGSKTIGVPNANPIIDPQARDYGTLTNTALAFAVKATDADGDALTYTVTGVDGGTVANAGSGRFVYTPTSTFTGKDSFVVTVTDGRGGSAEQLVNMSVGALPSPTDWRLFARDGYVGDMGGKGTIFGTSAYQNMAVIDVPGSINFDPSFNRGGDIIRLNKDAAFWEVVRQGSSALFSDGDTFVTIPVGAGLQVFFSDGLRILGIDNATGAVKIGNQTITTQFEPVTAPVQAELPIVEVLNPSGRLFLKTGAEVTLGVNGKLDVFGTNGVEKINALFGDLALDPSFNGGGDVLTLNRATTAFSAVRTGSSIRLDSSSLDVTVPLGTTGMTLDFTNADRVIVFDQLAGSALIGTQQIGFTQLQLIA